MSAKEPEAKPKKSSIGGLRTPRVTEDASRGLDLGFKVPTPLPKTSEEFIRRFGPLTVEIQQALTAILMLDSPEYNIVIDSLNALQKFCKKREENKEMYVELGGLPVLQKRMFDNHTVVQRMCMKILALVSSVHKTKLFIRDLDLAKDLLSLCEGKDDVIVEYACKSLSNLATLHTGRLQIIQHPRGLSTLFSLLNHIDPDVQRNALETIWQISADPLHLSLITGKSYVGAILKLVDSEYPPLQALALLILERVAQRPEGIANLEKLGATPVLARKLTNETMVDLHRHCLRIFYHQCKDRATCRKFAFLTPAIAEVVERTPDPVAKVNGIELLGRLCSLEFVARGLAESGMPYHLLSLLTSSESDQPLKEACAFITAQIARSSYSSKKEFAKCIPALLTMVQNNEKSSVKGVERSLVAISAILEDIVNSIEEFTKARGFDILRRLLENPENYSDDAIISALNIIDIIAGNPSQRSAVVQADFLPILLKLIHQNEPEPEENQLEKGQSQAALENVPESVEEPAAVEAAQLPAAKIPSKNKSITNPQIHTATCNILCSILCEPATHAEFSQQKGPEIVLSMMNHEEFPVVSAAVSIVNVACADPYLGKEMLDKGLLQTMWNRADLIGINGPLRAAFDRLVSANLSLKYSITGHLSPFERLQNGFYDMGGLKRLEELRFPQDFTWEERAQPKHMIFLLNVGPLELDPQLLEKNESLRTLQEQGQGLQDIIAEIQSHKESIDSEPFLVGVIAKAVSDRFGGPLDKWRLTANSEDIEVENIQNQYKSVIVPVSFLTTGTYRIRALVFKALCDLFGIPCSLETGDYRKTWNVVLLRPDERFPRMCPCLEELEKQGTNFVYTDSLRRYVVDLVFQPGTLLPLGSFEAETYISAS